MWDITAIPGIPDDYLPSPDQIPPFVRTPEQLRRWCVCFALTRQHVGFDSPHLARALYSSNIPTDAAAPA